NLTHNKFKMNKEQALKEALFKNIVSTLAINDYIVSTQSSYQCFKKELSLVDDIIKRAKFTQINNYMALERKTCVAARIPAEDDYRQATRNTQYPNFNHIKIAYKRSAGNPHLFDATVAVETYIYYFRLPKFTSHSTAMKSFIIKNIDISHHNNVHIDSQPWGWLATTIPTMVKKNYRKNYSIELYSDKRVSDWIEVIGGNRLFNENIPHLPSNKSSNCIQ